MPNEAQTVLATIGVDLLSLDAVAQASNAHEFEVKDPAGKSYPNGGIFLKVLGRNAQVVTDYYTAQVNEYIQRGEYAKRRNKPVESKTAEQLREDNINGAAVRTVGWRGIKQEFNQNLLKDALKRNPHWIEQIVDESDDLGNY